MRPIRIVTIAPTPYLDGPGAVIKGILMHLDRLHFEPSFISIINRPESARYPHMIETLKKLNIPFNCMNMVKPLDLLSPFRIASFLRRQRPDIVHTHMIRGNIYGRVAALLAGVRQVVSTVHSSKQWMESHPLIESSADLLDKLTVGIASKVVTVSEELQEKLVKLHGYRYCDLMTIPNGIDLGLFEKGEADRAEARRWIGADENSFIVGFVGRIDKEKNPLLMMEVMKRVFQKQPEVLLAVAGEGRMRDQVADRVRSLGIVDKVRLMGHIKDIPLLLSGFDAFFMCSLYEGHPIALCEAMASGLPCVTTPVGGTRRMMKHEKNGFVVGFNDIMGMEETLLALIRNRSLAASVGQAARATIREEFTEERMSQAYQSLYKSLMEADSAVV